MIELTFDFRKFLGETKSVIVTPAEHFAVLEKNGGFTEPVIKTLIYGFTAGLISLFSSVLFLGGVAGIIAVITSVIFSITALFMGGAILLVISALCGGSRDYEANARVTSSLMIIYPVYALFGLSAGINFWIGGVVVVAVNLLGIWLLYNALIKSLQCREDIVRIVAAVFAVLSILMAINNFYHSKDTRMFMDQMKSAEEDRENRQKEMDKKFNLEIQNVHKKTEDMKNGESEEKKSN